MASLSEIVEQEVVASPRGKLSITSESSLVFCRLIEIVLSADIKCSDCQRKIADIISRNIFNIGERIGEESDTEHVHIPVTGESPNHTAKLFSAKMSTFKAVSETSVTFSAVSVSGDTKSHDFPF
ncbi:hypothetical protein HID58_095392 [Brassica napus]|uniref:HMA domain-containing protein n=1 Tax=Brassica napus TaxID=3708 RepID=A0ABQ7X3U0_BRANA|nr:hypothetical protein HID58_095392 [Brassica napus]